MTKPIEARPLVRRLTRALERIDGRRVTGGCDLCDQVVEPPASGRLMPRARWG